jgi:hypothetical protein
VDRNNSGAYPGCRLEAIRLLTPDAVPVMPRLTTLTSDADANLSELRQEIMQYVAQCVSSI